MDGPEALVPEMSQLASLKAVSRLATHSSTAAQRGLVRREEVWVGARGVMTAPKFSQLLFHFQSYWLLVSGRLVLTSWLVLRMRPPFLDLDKYPRKLLISGLMEI